MKFNKTTRLLLVIAQLFWSVPIYGQDILRPRPVEERRNAEFKNKSANKSSLIRRRDIVVATVGGIVGGVIGSYITHKVDTAHKPVQEAVVQPQLPPLPNGPSPFLSRPVGYINKFFDRQKEYSFRMRWLNHYIPIDYPVHGSAEALLEKYGLRPWRELSAEMQNGTIRDDQFTRFMEAGNAICYEFEFQGEHYSENSPAFQEALELSRVIWNHFDVTVETAAAVFLPTELAELLEISQRIDTPFSFLLKRDILESKKPRIGIFTDRNGKKHYHDPGFPRLVDDCVRITRLAIDDLKALKPEAARPFLMKLQKDLDEERRLISLLTKRLYLPKGLEQELSAVYSSVFEYVRKIESAQAGEKTPILAVIVDDFLEKDILRRKIGFVHGKEVENHLRRYLGDTAVVGFHYPGIDVLERGHHLQQISRAVRVGAHIMNLSFGWPNEGKDKLSDSEKEYLRWVSQKLLIIAPAGNDSAERLDFPASLPSALSVGVKVKSNGKRINAWYSNWAPGLCLAVPIEQIDPKVWGTSFGAPVIAARVIRELSANPSILREDLIDLLRREGYDSPADSRRQPRPVGMEKGDLEKSTTSARENLKAVLFNI